MHEQAVFKNCNGLLIEAQRATASLLPGCRNDMKFVAGIRHSPCGERTKATCHFRRWKNWKERGSDVNVLIAKQHRRLVGNPYLSYCLQMR